MIGPLLLHGMLETLIYGFLDVTLLEHSNNLFVGE